LLASRWFPTRRREQVPSEVILPEGWPRPSGYSHGLAVRGGKDVFVAGQFAWAPSTKTCVEGGFTAQWDQALANVADVVTAAGGTGQNIVSMRIYVLDMEEYRKSSPADLGGSWVKHIGKWFPTVTMVQVGALEDPDALIEIEALARVDD
jgi:enamine deaminase RidA (YjgF/YER057c/UK114 family)